MISAERRLALIDLLGEQDVFSVEALARRFAVSTQTVRRDLRALEAQGLLRRTYGGAITRGNEPAPERAFHTRLDENGQLKEEIARAALHLLQPDQTIMFDASSTVLHLARLLPMDFTGTAVVNALPIAMELSRRSGLNVTFLGGTLRHTSLSFAGPLAEATLRRLFVDTAVISARGYSVAHGVTEANPYEAQLKELVVAKSQQVIALIDASKLGKAALMQVAPVDCVRVLVTDHSADPETVAAIRQCGVEVIVAPVPSEQLKTG
jgi:DeoR family fructose operon transcriptional repressor